MCSSICLSLFRANVLVPRCQWQQNLKNLRYWKLPHSGRKFTFFIQHSPISSSFDHDDTSISSSSAKPTSKQKQSQVCSSFLQFSSFLLPFCSSINHVRVKILNRKYILDFFLQLGYDPSEELFGLTTTDTQQRSWLFFFCIFCYLFVYMSSHLHFSDISFCKVKMFTFNLHVANQGFSFFCCWGTEVWFVKSCISL